MGRSWSVRLELDPHAAVRLGVDLHDAARDSSCPADRSGSPPGGERRDVDRVIAVGRQRDRQAELDPCGPSPLRGVSDDGIRASEEMRCRFEVAVGSSGTVLCVADMAWARRVDRERRTGNLTFTKAEVDDIVTDLVDAPTAKERLGLPIADAIFASLVGHSSAVTQTESIRRISRDRARHKRGPPILSSLA